MSNEDIRKGDKRMAAITKPTNKAFVLDPAKTDAFFSNKNSGAKKALDRFFAHQPKEGVKTPCKGKDV